MNTKLKTVAALLMAIAGFAVLWPSLARHSYAAEPHAVEQYKVLYMENTGENFETELNKLAASGWKFKAALRDKEVLLSK
ncbi:MAG: hypothetical protein WCD79_09335 [Chthoniobacteraceae bacterium]